MQMDVPGVAIAEMVKTLSLNSSWALIVINWTCYLFPALPIINEAIDAAKQSDKSATNYIFVNVDRDLWVAQIATCINW